ncbi:MAG: hypothetical protein WA667_15525 [Candidatus Nitrosopolaris sp.]
MDNKQKKTRLFNYKQAHDSYGSTSQDYRARSVGLDRNGEWPMPIVRTYSLSGGVRGKRKI